MDRFVGLDVLVRETGLCVVDANGTRLKEARVPTEPEAIAAVLEGGGFTLVAQASRPGRCRSGSRPDLAARGLPVICAQAHHMRAALAAQREPRPIAHCARGIAQMMRGGLHRPVHVKTREAQVMRLLLTARKLLQSKMLDVGAELRGTLENFGLRVGRVRKGGSSDRVRGLVADDAALAVVATARHERPRRDRGPAHGAATRASSRWCATTRCAGAR